MTRVTRILKAIENHKLFSALIIVGIAVIGLNRFVESTQSLLRAFRKQTPIVTKAAFILEGAGELKDVKELLPSARVALAWKTDHDELYSWPSTSIVPSAEGRFTYRLIISDSTPPDRALMFFAEPGSTALTGRLGLGTVFVYSDDNGSEQFEEVDDRIVGGSNDYAVAYLSGKLPADIANFQGGEQGYSLVAVRANGYAGSPPKLISAPPGTKVRLVGIRQLHPREP
jgi:hypothetical protein